MSKLKDIMIVDSNRKKTKNIDNNPNYKLSKQFVKKVRTLKKINPTPIGIDFILYDDHKLVFVS